MKRMQTLIEYPLFMDCDEIFSDKTGVASAE